MNFANRNCNREIDMRYPQEWIEWLKDHKPDGSLSVHKMKQLKLSFLDLLNEGLVTDRGDGERIFDPHITVKGLETIADNR
jgi:hypothetical protein